VPETNEQDKSREGLVLAAGATTGAGLGLYSANYIFPPTVDFINNDVVKAQVSLSLSDPGLHAVYGPKLDAPNVHIADLPLVGNIGLNARIDEFNVDITDPNSSDQVSSLFAKHDSAIVTPIKHAIYERMATGAITGCIAGIALSYMALQTYRMKKHDGTFDYIKNKIGKLGENTKKIVAGALATVALAGCGVAIEQSTESDNAGIKHKLPSSITDNRPELKDATVSGLGGEALVFLAKASTAYKQNVNESLAISRENFWQEFEEYSSKKSMFTDRKYKVAMHISDAHCNYAMYEYALGPVVKAFQPDIVLNTGDTFTNGGIMFYEKDCMSSLIKTIGDNTTDTTMVNTIGNHDPKKPVNHDKDPRVVTPSKDTNYVVHTEIGDIVVTPDKSLTTWSTTPDEDGEAMDELTAEQGAITSKSACEQYSETGKKPIVMVHRPFASAKVTAKGCASLVLKGHTHQRQKLKIVESRDGSKTLHHIAGSSSGTHNTIAIYETPKRPATYTMFYFDQANKIKGATNITFDTDSSVTIEDEKVPTKTQDARTYEKYEAFLRKFDPDF